MSVASNCAVCTIILLSAVAITFSYHDYVKHGRYDDGPFPSSLKNMPYYCYQVPSKGPCEGMFFVWFFDVVRRKCMPMIYSGCGGNENRFTTQASCYIHCEKSRRI
ncbi:kunitz serine protease inhibitor Pr-mulgin 2-like isoform X1 [Colias croceus]|uniref:kunitz serine protease inhibitor Pr-mulgin 2-like isoform X1 n=1 Tax=Colias crocea TaxID=72248 RepID=UPI001E27B809|nr:kunitz serine protease inhibitor Pr-mulgin 2-like isoform X1 [Colias croceus]CAG4964651.1 unnamed protein product [Colias eurytheme]